MKLSIYNAHWSSWGGGEKYTIALANALAEKYDVTLLMESPESREWERRFNIGLKSVNVRNVVDPSKEANIVLSNDRPLGRKLIYILQIALPRRTTKDYFRWVVLEHRHRRPMQELKRAKLLRDAKRSDLVLVYSNFVRDELKKTHGIEATVLYPPVDDFASTLPKKKVIISVGRFFAQSWNVKNHFTLIEAFRLFHRHHPDWEYRLIGGATPDAASYLDQLYREAAGYPVTFHVNIPYKELAQHYGEATFFWHGTGYGTDKPEEMESFGITTVEAMSAGCIPLVFGNGGQREILESLSAGVFWRTPENLELFTEMLVLDPKLAAMHRLNARKRFEDFTYARFKERALDIFSKLEGR